MREIAGRGDIEMLNPDPDSAVFKLCDCRASGRRRRISAGKRDVFRAMSGEPLCSVQSQCAKSAGDQIRTFGVNREATDRMPQEQLPDMPRLRHKPECRNARCKWKYPERQWGNCTRFSPVHQISQEVADRLRFASENPV